VFHALRKDRNQRFQHMREMGLALQATPEMPGLPFRLSLPSPVPGAARSSPQAISVPPPLERAVDAATPLPAAPSGPVAWPPQSPLRGPLRARWVGVCVALGVAAAVVYDVRDRSGGSSSTQARVALPPSAEVVHARTAPREPAALGAVRADEGLDLITVRVSTQPAGARVRLAGGGEVCSTTPCSFDVVRGAPISLQARRGGHQAIATLNPTVATQLHLVLEPKASRPTTLAGSPDDLKVPQIFRDPQR
jgi:hypothetical protein